MTPPPTMMTVPALPPMIAPTTRAAPPTIIIAPFSDVGPEPNARTAGASGALTVVADIAFTQDGTPSDAGARATATFDGSARVGAATLSAVVSGRVAPR